MPAMFPRDVEDRNDEVPLYPRRASNSIQNRENLFSLILTYERFNCLTNGQHFLLLQMNL